MSLSDWLSAVSAQRHAAYPLGQIMAYRFGKFRASGG